MAITLEGRDLTTQHRIEQVRVTAPIVAESIALWDSLLDIDDLDGTAPLWSAVQMEVTRSRYATSQGLAVEYLPRFRAAEVGSADMTIVRPWFDVAAAGTTMRVAGPVAVKAFIGSGMPAATAYATARNGFAGRMQEWALGGGRQTIRASSLADSTARGYRRVTDGNPCAFCALLVARDITRGDFGDAGFKAHRKCGCSAEPVYGPPNLSDVEESWVAAYNSAAKATSKAGEARSASNVLGRMRRQNPDLFHDGIH